MKYRSYGRLIAAALAASVILSSAVPTFAAETDETNPGISAAAQEENSGAPASEAQDAGDEEVRDDAQQDSSVKQPEADADSSVKQPEADADADSSVKQPDTDADADSSVKQPEADADSSAEQSDRDADANTGDSGSGEEAQQDDSTGQEEETIESEEVTEDYENLFVYNTEDEEAAYPLDMDFGKMASSLKKDSQGRYNVRDCGAGPSKSAATNYNVIQNCLNQARNSRGTTTVYIPSGTYTIQYTLRVYSNTRIVMDSGTVLKQGTSNRVIFATDYTGKKGGYSLASNITVSGGTLDGGNTSADHKGTLLHFFHSRNVTLENLTVANAASRHPVVLGGIDTVSISGCTFRNCNRSTALDTTSKRLSEALHIDAISPDGVSESTEPYDGTVCNNVTVQNCRFQGVFCGVGGHYSDYPQRGNGFTVKNCTFTDVYSTAVNAMNYNNINISGNSSSGGRCFADIYNCTGTVSGNSCGNTSDSMLSVWSWTGCSQDGSLNINSNTFGNDGDYGINIRTTTPGNLDKNGATARQGVNIANVTVSNNTFGTSVRGGARVNDAANVTLSGNHFGAVSSGNGILLNNVKTASVTGNTVENASGDGIRISGSSTDIKVSSNMVEACSGKGINALSSATGSASDNTAPSASTYDNSRFVISGTRDTGRWVDVNGTRHFYQNGRDVYRNAWARIGGSWYYFGNDSAAYRNRWFWNGAQWFYFGNDCAAYANRWLWNGAQWFYFGSDCAAYTNRWFYNGAQWFYFGSDCAAYTNRWFYNGAQWFYFGSDAAAYANRWFYNGAQWFYFGSDTAAYANKWFYNGAQWFYFGNDAAAYANCRSKIGGHWYSFGSDAAMK